MILRLYGTKIYTAVVIHPFSEFRSLNAAVISDISATYTYSSLSLSLYIYIYIYIYMYIRYKSGEKEDEELENLCIGFSLISFVSFLMSEALRRSRAHCPPPGYTINMRYR